MSLATMARPKKQAVPPKPKTIGIRTTPEWSEWVEALAAHYRTTVSGVIDRALAEWTEAEGYPVRPPRRS